MSNYFSDAGKKIRTSTEETLHKILSLARLPIPPYPHANTSIQFGIKFIKTKLSYHADTSICHDTCHRRTFEDSFFLLFYKYDDN